jgi:hypothetical protein
MVATLSHMGLVPNFPFYPLDVHFNIILTSNPRWSSFVASGQHSQYTVYNIQTSVPKLSSIVEPPKWFSISRGPPNMKKFTDLQNIGSSERYSVAAKLLSRKFVLKELKFNQRTLAVKHWVISQIL